MIGVILTAGRADAGLQTLFGPTTSGLIPLGGRPAVSFIIPRLVAAGADAIYIGVDVNAPDTDFLVQVARTVTPPRIPLEFVAADPLLGPGNSLLTVARAARQGPAVVCLGDSIVEWNGAPRETNWVGVVPYRGGFRRWCAVRLANGIVEEFFEKLEDPPASHVCVGIYGIADIASLSHIGILDSSSILQVSDVLSASAKVQGCPVKALEVSRWWDVGHIDMYRAARRELLETRFFHRLEFDTVLATVTKRSRRKEHLEEVVAWHRALPTPLEVLAPRILSTGSDDEEAWMCMEYYGYPTAADIWIFSAFDITALIELLGRFCQILELFGRHKRPVSRAAHRLMLRDKTIERIDQLPRQSKVAELLRRHEVRINGVPCRGWPALEPLVSDAVEAMYDESFHCLLHGDFCLSNILYDPLSGVVRLIDPRGKWGGEMGGDLRYDMAKLRHSVVGGYDFIVNDLFAVHVEDDEITYQIFRRDELCRAGESLDGLLEGLGARIGDVKLIEGILFLSMLALHADRPTRQLCMLAVGLQRLNEVFPV